MNSDHTNVAERIEQLLANCHKLKRASALRRILFDDDGEAHARALADRDADDKKVLRTFS